MEALLLKKKFIDEIEQFQPEAQIERALTPPASWYLDPDFFELEKLTVFENQWL